jgi:alpha-L-fucosidase
MRKISGIIFIISITLFGLSAQNKKAQTKSSAEPYLLPPFPSVPAILPQDSVTMADWKSFPEMKLNIPIASGPFEPTWESIEKNYPGEPA